MAQREFKQLSFRDLGLYCDFLVRSEKEDEVVSMAADHACRVHNICEVTPELESKMHGAMKSLWCEEKCHNAPKIELIPPLGYKS